MNLYEAEIAKKVRGFMHSGKKINGDKKIENKTIFRLNQICLINHQDQRFP